MSSKPEFINLIPAPLVIARPIALSAILLPLPFPHNNYFPLHLCVHYLFRVLIIPRVPLRSLRLCVHYLFRVLIIPRVPLRSLRFCVHYLFRVLIIPHVPLLLLRLCVY